MRIGFLIFLLFQFNAVIGQWNQIGSDIIGFSEDQWLGRAVGFSGDGSTCVIGIPGYDGANGDKCGAVQVYDWDGFNWIQRGNTIEGEDTSDYSGNVVDIDITGNIIATGTHLNDGNGIDAGHVRVYEWNGSGWIQKGLDIDGVGTWNYSARSISLNDNGNVIAVSGDWNISDTTGGYPGHIRIYEWSGLAWLQKGNYIEGDAIGDYFGWSLSLDSIGNTVIIGAIENEGINGVESGHAKVYEWGGNDWVQKGQDIDGEAADDNSGWSVSISSNGNTVAIGAPKNDGQLLNQFFSGHVRIYRWNGTDWIQKGQDIDGLTYATKFGSTVVLSSDGEIVAIKGDAFIGSEKLDKVQTFQWDGIQWNQIGYDLNGETHYGIFGIAIDIDRTANRMIVSEPRFDVVDHDYLGKVKIYEYCPMDQIYITDTAFNHFDWIDGVRYHFSDSTLQHTLTNIHGCDSVIILNLTIIQTSNNSENDISDFVVFPNPSNGVYNIISPLEIQDNLIFDLSGRLLFSSKSKQLNLNKLSSGVYLLLTITEDAIIKTNLVVTR